MPASHVQYRKHRYFSPVSIFSEQTSVSMAGGLCQLLNGSVMDGSLLDGSLLDGSLLNGSVMDGSLHIAY